MEMLELAAELKWCREQIALYEVERAQMQQYYRRAIADRDDAKATITRLREYAWHKFDCEKRCIPIGYHSCTCGYDDLIKEIGNDA